jgi:hypothetical protein
MAGYRTAPGLPGLFYGTMLRGSETRELSFLVLMPSVRPDRAEFGVSESGTTVCNADRLTGTGTLTLNGRTIQAEHVMVLRADGTRVETETLSLYGADVEPGLGRVFLLDLDDPEALLQQIDVPLKTVPLELGDLEAAVADIAEKLVRDNPEVRAFLER